MRTFFRQLLQKSGNTVGRVIPHSFEIQVHQGNRLPGLKPVHLCIAAEGIAVTLLQGIIEQTAFLRFRGQLQAEAGIVAQAGIGCFIVFSQNRVKKG